MRQLSEWLDREILPRVEKPSRYLGTELNAVHKDPARVRLRACLAFPDSYDLGLGNLGLQILYHILNQRPEFWAERVCAPHPDLEALLRERGLPLFALESKTPLHAFDLLGFTLQWELNYTNILNMLDLGGVPPLAAERSAQHPLVIAGGPCVFNPEPLALFIDAFVIGDGEEVVLELADAVAAGGDRETVLDRLASLDGVYVPARYPMIEVGGRLVPPPDAPRIRKRLVRDLDATPFPTDYLVPYAAQVHDRVALEVLRGCTQSCRFCQAGMVTRPVRERSLDNLARLQVETMQRTGYEEISLVSLSTCDYSQVKSLVRQAVELATPEHIGVSLPSLRLDSFSVDLANQLGNVRKSGITFAPEAATDRMRAVINKFISREDLLDMSRQCFQQGWDQIKLYFMIGLPTETDDDVKAIGELAREVWFVGRPLRGGRAKVNLGISTFVPKPQTPFQWAAQIPMAETRRRQGLLRGQLHNIKAIKFGRHDAFETYLEGLITRGDRRLGWLIYWAWQAGARFDGWYEYRTQEAWQTACERWQAEFGRDPATELEEREVPAPLPWDHIDVLIPKGWLAADWERARHLDWQRDCRRDDGKCNRCGVIDQERAACTAMLRRSREGARADADLSLAGPQTPPDLPAIGSLRFRWERRGLARLLSHKELMNVFIRALRRARLPLKYSEGFHPHASLSFSTALPVGLETVGDWCDVQITAAVEPEQFLSALNAALPPGFAVHEGWLVAVSEPSLMATLDCAAWRAELPPELAGDDLAERVAQYLAQPQIIAQRRGKQQGQVVHRPVDIKPMIRSLQVAAEGVLELQMVSHDGRPPKVDDVLTTLLNCSSDALLGVRVLKLASLRQVGDALLPPAPPVLETV
ncbi:MAG: TIGR03960 family B12-binding radical SAM protein [Fimbriimonadaceae bacterium]|nr:TIGR03960 family B12-binding radical SAM protein [Fimbriimonadaceae bacterium]